MSEKTEDKPEEKPAVEEATVKGESGEESFVLPESLPLLPVRDVVVFPFMILPLRVAREASIRAVDEALSKDRLILLVTQRDPGEEEPGPEGLFTVGTVASIMRMLKLPDGGVRILVQGLTKARIREVTSTHPTFVARIEEVKEPPPSVSGIEIEALLRSVRDLLEKVSSLGKALPPDLMVIVGNIREPGRLADLVASNLGFKIEDAQQLLEDIDPVKRLKRVHELLAKETEVLGLQAKIQSEAREEMTKTQRQYYLREQIRAIQQELGESDERQQELKELRDKIAKAKMPEEAEKEAKKQLGRLEAMNPDMAEAGVVRTYLDWLLDLPWSVATKDLLDLKEAHRILDEDHFDLQKVKDRILEFLAVRKLHEASKGPILCFVGPPGVGKTSLGRAIARAMGRKFVRISLGGVRDEAEIRGHRRTYVGALPGRIVQGIKQAGSNNPVFMLDEVDKLGADFRGDPAAALLEVLDPEQNHAFSDHYLNVAFDLSKVLFICTANQVDPIPSALQDRMEVLRLPGYTDQEKLQIAHRFLIPRQVEQNGLKTEIISFPDRTLLAIMNGYTREAGLRNFEREIAGICRKVARSIAEATEDGKGPYRINPRMLQRFLGPPKFLPEPEEGKDRVGVAAGLAWTPVGGEVLHVEASVVKGKGRLTLTGSLGDVMKESAQAALTFARSRAAQLGIDPNIFDRVDIHIHVPAGAIPKDGPSAGVAMATALVSALTRTPIKHDVSMTGEITLRGRVLPIGGLKEKALAALRAHLTTLIVPDQNRHDLTELPPPVRKKLDIHLVETVDEVLKTALAPKRRGQNHKKKVA